MPFFLEGGGGDVFKIPIIYFILWYHNTKFLIQYEVAIGNVTAFLFCLNVNSLSAIEEDKKPSPSFA